MESPGHRAAGDGCQTCHSPLDVAGPQPFFSICPLQFIYGQLSSPRIVCCQLSMGQASTDSAHCSSGSSQAGSYDKFVPVATVPKVYCHGVSPALTPPTAKQALWSEHPITSSSHGTWCAGSTWGSGWLPSSTLGHCHCSITKVPHLQRAQVGWRCRAVTMVPVTTKLVARGDATAARLSSGPAVSCVHQADMGQTAKVRLLLPMGWQQCRGFVWRWLWHVVLPGEGVGAGLTSLQLTGWESVLPCMHQSRMLRSDLWGWGLREI